MPRTQGLLRQSLILSLSPRAHGHLGKASPGAKPHSHCRAGQPRDPLQGDRDCPLGPSAPKPVWNVRLLLQKTEMLANIPVLPVTVTLGTLPHGNP